MYFRSDSQFLVPAAPPLTLLNIRHSSCSVTDIEQLLARSHATLQTASFSIFAQFLSATKLASILCNFAALKDLCLEMYLPSDNEEFLSSGAEAIFKSVTALERLSILFESLQSPTTVPSTFSATFRNAPATFRCNLKQLDMTSMQVDENWIQLIEDRCLPDLNTFSSPSLKDSVEDLSSDAQVLFKAACKREGINVIEEECFEYYVNGVNVQK